VRLAGRPQAKGESLNTNDRAWFEPLVRTLARPAWKYAFVLVHDMDIAQDIVQEAFARLWASPNTPSTDVEFRRYLYRTIANLAHNYRRQQMQRAAVSVTAPEAANPLDEVDRRAGDQVLRAALRRLTLRQRKAVYLRYYEDRSFSETARIMGMPQVTARVIVHRALAKLRDRLQTSSTNDKVAIS
jgi:RNA polymerase sigma factor (sigma-70 family)